LAAFETGGPALAERLKSLLKVYRAKKQGLVARFKFHAMPQASAWPVESPLSQLDRKRCVCPDLRRDVERSCDRCSRRHQFIDQSPFHANSRRNESACEGHRLGAPETDAPVQRPA